MRYLFVLFCFYIPVLVFGQVNHDKLIVVDAHNDVISQVVLHGKSMETDLTGKAHTDINRLLKGGMDVQIFAIFCDQTFGVGTAFKEAIRQMDTLRNIIARNPQTMLAASSYRHVKKAVKQHKIACMMGVEGGHMIENRMDYLDSLYNRGARYLTLTWNNSTPWATSAKDEVENTVPAYNLRRGFAVADRGLDSFGRAVVQHMNELGMLVDVSHVGEATFWDVIRTSTKPVIASHSSAYALCPFRRNLKDDQIKAVAKNGGVIHVNFFSGFLDSTYDRRAAAFDLLHKPEVDSMRKLQVPGVEIGRYLKKNYAAELEALRPPMSLLIDHIDHIVKLAGIDHVGLGSDFDGIGSSPVGLDDVQGFRNITKALEERGYRKKDIAKIMGGNFLRLLRAL